MLLVWHNIVEAFCWKRLSLQAFAGKVGAASFEMMSVTHVFISIALKIYNWNTFLLNYKLFIH